MSILSEPELRSLTLQPVTQTPSEGFKYLEVLFIRKSQMDRETDRLIRLASVLMQMLYCSTVVKKELCQKAKLLIYKLIYVTTLT